MIKQLLVREPGSSFGSEVEGLRQDLVEAHANKEKLFEQILAQVRTFNVKKPSG